MYNINFRYTIGQNKVKQYLMNALANGTFPQAILFHSLEGRGQNSLLYDLIDYFFDSKTKQYFIPIFPQSHNSDRKNNHDNNQRLIKSRELFEKFSNIPNHQNSHDLLDPYYIKSSIKEMISIHQIKDIEKQIIHKENKDQIRIIVIFNIEKLNIPASNALLKILEEPPVNTHFIMSCNQKSSLLPTILSRCQQINLDPLSTQEIEDYLTKKKLKLQQYLPFCEQSIGKILSFEDFEENNLIQIAQTLLNHLIEPKTLNFINWLNESKNPINDSSHCIEIFKICLEILRINLYTFYDSTQKKNNHFDLNKKLNINEIKQIQTFLNSNILRISNYSKPNISLLGLFLDFKEKYKI